MRKRLAGIYGKPGVRIDRQRSLVSLSFDRALFSSTRTSTDLMRRRQHGTKRTVFVSSISPHAPRHKTPTPTTTNGDERRRAKTNVVSKKTRRQRTPDDMGQDRLTTRIARQDEKRGGGTIQDEDDARGRGRLWQDDEDDTHSPPRSYEAIRRDERRHDAKTRRRTRRRDETQDETLCAVFVSSTSRAAYIKHSPGRPLGRSRPSPPWNKITRNWGAE